MFEAQKNLKPHEIIALIEQSKHKAVRRITDTRTGDFWYWKAELLRTPKALKSLVCHMTGDQAKGIFSPFRRG
jgi:hypothetical protein